MSRFHSYISTAATILGSYRGETPFVHHLKKYFSGHAKHGSRDRKLIAGLCYDYFRTGHAFRGQPLDEVLPLCWFLCERSDPGFLTGHPHLQELVAVPVEEKLAAISLHPDAIFPFGNLLEQGIDTEKFALSFLTQPDLFLRIRPGMAAQVQSKLEDAVVQADFSGSTVRLPNTTKVGELLKIDREVVIQDLESQHVLDHLLGAGLTIKEVPAVWDCCAASGGKSILLYDLLKGRLKLTVSDIRENILVNLKERTRKAGISLQDAMILNLEEGLPASFPMFDIIVCDAPCTGSGTWGRTPEQLFYFNADSVEAYASRQQHIAQRAISQLKEGGLFFYITCSAFARENEAVVEWITSQADCRLLSAKYLVGYEQKADTMFVAVFTR